MSEYLTTKLYTSEGMYVAELNVDPITGDYFVILNEELYDYYEGTTEFFD